MPRELKEPPRRAKLCLHTEQENLGIESWHHLALEIRQEELGDRSRLHRAYIGHLERDEVDPSLLNILKVAAVISCTIQAS